MPFRRSFRCKLCDDFSFFYILKFIFVNVHGFSYQLTVLSLSFEPLGWYYISMSSYRRHWNITSGQRLLTRRHIFLSVCLIVIVIYVRIRAGLVHTCYVFCTEFLCIDCTSKKKAKTNRKQKSSFRNFQITHKDTGEPKRCIGNLYLVPLEHKFAI